MQKKIAKKYKNLSIDEALKICDKYGGILQCEDCPLQVNYKDKKGSAIFCYLTKIEHNNIKTEEEVRKEYGNLTIKELNNICKKYYADCCLKCPLKYLDKETKDSDIKYKKLCDDKKYKKK